MKKRAISCLGVYPDAVAGDLPVPPHGAAALYELPEGKTLSSSSAILVALGATEDEDVVLYEKEADQSARPPPWCASWWGVGPENHTQEKGIDTVPPPAPTPCSATT